MKETKTAIFIPNVSLSEDELTKLYNNGYINIFLGIKHANKKEYGKHLYALVSTDYDFSSFTNYIDEISVDNNRLLRFKIPKKYKKSVVKPFIEGSYSKIDKKFVHKFTNKKLNDQTINSVWKIFHKAPSIKEYWEHRIGVVLPEDAEVWSKPIKSQEIFQL